MTSDQALVLRNFLLPALDNEHKNTRRVLQSVPQDKSGYKPDEASMTAYELVAHIVACELGFLDGVITGEFKSFAAEKNAPLQDIVDNYVSGFQEKVASLKTMSGEELARDINFFGRMQMPAVTFLNLSNSHSIHHRGQLTVYLRPMGSKVPSVYGESRDDREARLAATAAN